MFRRLLREPLLHFLLIGRVLFALARFTGDPGQRGPGRIVVSPGQIEQLIERFTRVWQRPPTTTELEGLIEDHVNEEVLYREALSMGLDQGDTIIRRRLRQKMEFLSEDLANVEASEADLRAFLDDHPEKFRTDSTISFQQVYLNQDRRGDSTEAEAARLLKRLRGNGAADWERLGDPFLLDPAYESIPQRQVGSLFGSAFAEQMFQVEIDRWVGPLESGFGLHLVFVSRRVDGRVPDLASTRHAVRREWDAVHRERSNREFLLRLREQYEISIQLPGWLEAQTRESLEQGH